MSELLQFAFSGLTVGAVYALVALGNAGDPELAPLAARAAEADDPLLAEAGAWALRRTAAC